MLQFIGIHEIVGGVLICAPECVGVSSSKDPKSHCKNDVHMGFSVVACSVSALGFYLHPVFKS